jgi:hypothetical protein
VLFKPTENRIEINGSEIDSVEMTNAFLDKSIKIFTHSGSEFKFSVPKKQLESVNQILNEMRHT